ncbi:MAG: twin-arginine translocase subunit TatC [Candidatus Eisenbacteria bacterium]|uniref:Sec-independent protein translocase protein TatC n=1 Tax=Eiseniibacteriota bacterium TaxID=2212470 RepID=A0A538SE01_UNCEI|nr:MAG: twin-arginine translocase subunit TatC [Candidatus Eisenbacteria bacterium]
MTFLEHIEELRAAVWRSVAIAVILIATAWFFSGRLLDALILYLLRGQKALALSPTEAFSARIEVALWTGGVVALPYVMFELWRFVAPGLKKTERHFAVPWMVASAVLLYLGIAFAIELLLPMIVRMLQSFATGQIEPRMSLLSLLHFSVKMAAGCGLLFQLPLVLCLLAWFGIVSPGVLARQWRHAVFFIALAAAVVTPGDGPSMLVLSAPLVLLYFVSLILAWAIWRSRWKDRHEPGWLG